MVLIYAVAGEPLLRAVFGDDLTEASGALPWLGLAMSLLACSYLSVQYLLAWAGRASCWCSPPRSWSRCRCCSSIGDDLTAIAIALFAHPGSSARRRS